MIHFLKKQDRPRKFGPRRRPIRPQNRRLALSPRSPLPEAELWAMLKLLLQYLACELVAC